MENLDPELQAMTSIAALLTNLDEESRARVLNWAADKFGVSISGNNVNLSIDGDGSEGNDKERPQGKNYVDFVDLFDDVTPNSNFEKALTGAYWIQAMQGEPSWRSLQVNNLLKDTGNGIDHIVDALGSAQRKNPALVRQMAKSGKSRQARKTFKLTSAGIKFIASKIGDGTDLTGEE